VSIKAMKTGRQGIEENRRNHNKGKWWLALLGELLFLR